MTTDRALGLRGQGLVFFGDAARAVELEGVERRAAPAVEQSHGGAARRWRVGNIEGY